LAREGFVVFAPDLNAGQIATTIEAAHALMQARANERTEVAALGGLDYLLAHPALRGTSVGVIGFSMGGAWALLLSGMRPETISAAVIFYGSYQFDVAAARAAYLGHYVEQDEWEPLADIRLMEASIRDAGRDVTLHVYKDVGHWFFENDRPEYNPDAAALAWTRTLEFLRQQLGV